MKRNNSDYSPIITKLLDRSSELPQLEPDEIDALVKRFKAGDEAAGERLVIDCIQMATHRAGKFRKRPGRSRVVDNEDILAAFIGACVEAMYKYDPNGGKNFRSYAWGAMIYATRDALRHAGALSTPYWSESEWIVLSRSNMKNIELLRNALAPAVSLSGGNSSAQWSDQRDPDRWIEVSDKRAAVAFREADNEKDGEDIIKIMAGEVSPRDMDITLSMVMKGEPSRSAGERHGLSGTRAHQIMCETLEKTRYEIDRRERLGKRRKELT